MGKLITTEVALAYTNCPRKAFLLLNTASPPPPHDYVPICRARGEALRERHLAQIRRDYPDVVRYDQDRLGDGNRCLIGGDLRTGDLSASCDLLMRIDQSSSSGSHSYYPQVIAGTYSITEDQRFALSFAGYVLGLIQGSPPDHGMVITLDGVAHRVALVEGRQKVLSVLEEVRGMVDQNSKAPPVILNRHCPLCPFRNDCRSQAEESDDLSLLDRMTPKVIRRYHKKGIFTVNQLSYLFRPRRNRKRSRAKTAFNLELQALAIRTGKIYLQALPDIVPQPATIFLDIEGIPDEQFHYLVGLLVCRGEVRIPHSFWADVHEDEPRVWESLRSVLDANPDAAIVHYGSYESRAIVRMGQRYDTDVEPYLRRMINLNEVIFGRVYFPVRSNSLKVIGGFLGATWTEPDASGLQSLVWRHRWEETHDGGLQAKLIRYNQDDCLALQMLWDELVQIKQSADLNSKVDYADRPKQFASEVGKQVHARFEGILRFAHADYRKNRICVRTEDDGPKASSGRKRGAPKGHQAYQRILPTRADRVVTVARKRVCPKHKGERLLPSEESVEKFQIDLRFTKKGFKKIITKYTGQNAFCPQCNIHYPPPAIKRIGERLFGHGFQAWTVYQRIVLRLPYRVITDVMEDLFGERTSMGSVIRFMRYLAEYYKPCEEEMIRRMRENPFIHVDETRLNIQGTDHYVWIFTDGIRVVFRLTETRETDVVREMLAGYQGVLVSDFYPGYDAVECRQQKCLVHLIRDLNDDLWGSPYNTEFEGFVLAVKDLLVPIFAVVPEDGLKARRLIRFVPSVDEFYRQHITGRAYKFEVTRKYQKRFERYRESLFTFLGQDDIPWNNNTAERGIRHLAVQRKISRTFYKKAVPDYLLLLGIAQTCRFQDKSFLKFLMSGGMDIDAFRSGKRLRISKPVGTSLSLGETEGANRKRAIGPAETEQAL
jgi:predicted RecB family nuclease